MVRPSLLQLAAARGFQWERYEAWRHHPLLKINKAQYVPGLGLGIAFFVAFKLWEDPPPDHHH